MAEHSYETLKKKKVDDLREIAKGLDHEAVKGYTQLRKDQLLLGICTALGIDAQAHHRVVGIDKGVVKQQIHALQGEREEAIAAQDRVRLKRVRRKIHRLKRQLRAATV